MDKIASLNNGPEKSHAAAAGALKKNGVRGTKKLQHTLSPCDKTFEGDCPKLMLRHGTKFIL